ncbi:GIY-YIG nuclease family protein [Polaribacter tangerinus]|uniref:GIY-YIG nuclease family protein n=1 Tax=Polaribacter tangerinus TaxID=1920034 RepID=UPI000B4BDEF0
MFSVYILFSEQIHKFYVGNTSLTVHERLKQHLYNHKGFTSKAKDWKIIHSIKVEDKTKAILGINTKSCGTKKSFTFREGFLVGNEGFEPPTPSV